MSFNWESYIDLAGVLINTAKIQKPFEEAYLRSAMSRSYYGVFCMARNFLISKGRSISRIDTHRFVREEYRNSTDLVARSVGSGLGRLWLERKHADYENSAIINIPRAETAFFLAERVSKDLHKIVTI